jgi:hypothetical protein
MEIAKLDGKRIVIPPRDGDRDWSGQPMQASDWRQEKQSGSMAAALR